MQLIAQSNIHSLTNETFFVSDKFTCSLIRDTTFYDLGICFKEIILEQTGDTQQQISVYGFFIVNLIDICTAIRQFTSKPRGSFAL